MTAYVVEADGGSRGNPGPAGYGAVVRDAATGQVLAEVAEAIGLATNNVAEYRGLIAGLRAVLDLAGEGASVAVRMDSKLVVEQMAGRWKIKHEGLRPLALEAADLARRLRVTEWTWIPRERNADADRLANEAMDAAAKGLAWQGGGSAVPETGAPATGSAPEAAAGERDRTATGWRSPASTTATSVFLLRHGETPLSVERRFSGLGDAELTPAGLGQAAKAAERLAGERLEAVVSSPLKRARQTAEAVARLTGLEVEVDEDLRETDFGAWEGHTFAEVQQRWPEELAAWLADPDVAPPGGESFAVTARRVQRFRDRLLARHEGRRLVVVSHVTPIKMLLRFALLAPPASLYRMHLDLACLSLVDYHSDGQAVVRSFNDTSHLR
ncbi:bifunctional RNase H/acid phosphatase [Thermoactinospora rubra]|uniref:bifunctional RNase H/acid phosphatase n=1 Tax=Thermoactinospora rubra TaxID=1088767 RepID=UPI00198179AC|nr:bifunctional RNase H/acid phosphatase [Thermoactinospora rubra]